MAGYFRLKRIRCYPSKVYFISTYYFCQRTITLICVFVYTGQSFTTNVVHTVGMEHGLTIFRPAIVHDILPVEWTRTSRRPFGPVYIDLPGSRLIAVQWTCTKPPPLRTWSTLTRPSVPVYNTGADFPRPHRLAMP